MNTIQPELNLARKWRPKSFDHIVGQDVSVRMLKNGLYLKKFFPVYLFAGQRGCGKTSTARVFGAAVNCHNLETFQQNPNNSIPCLNCESCKAMINGHHPDFIEIDAASHTGVDNVRQIIDSSSYMPLLGHKKIYLIDEAHMLSKAAFNAFLKILEEPPVTVLFILATTEVPKIPQTVLSRCFQVLFTPIENINLKNHLLTICTQENITIEENALDLLLAETEGSARDAINLLERVRFSCSHITEGTILSVLGKISNQDLYTLFEHALNQQAIPLLNHLRTLSFETRSPQILWDMFITLCRTLLWIKYGAADALPMWAKNNEQLANLAKSCSIARLYAIYQLFWSQEELFFRTNKKHAFLEMVLLQLCEQVNIVDLEPLIQACNTGRVVTTSSTIQQRPQNIVVQSEPSATTKNNEQQNKTQPTPEQPTSQSQPEPWFIFLKKINQTGDALLGSIFAQAKLVVTPEQQESFHVELNSNSKFFKEKLEECKKIWQPLFIECFPSYKDILFQDPQNVTKLQSPLYQAVPITNPGENKIPSPVARQSATNTYKKGPFVNKAPSAGDFINKSNNLEIINIDNKEQWPLANLIMSHFPGKIRKQKE